MLRLARKFRSVDPLHGSCGLEKFLPRMKVLQHPGEKPPPLCPPQFQSPNPRIKHHLQCSLQRNPSRSHPRRGASPLSAASISPRSAAPALAAKFSLPTLSQPGNPKPACPPRRLPAAAPSQG